MVYVVVACGAEIRAKAAIMTGDDDAAAACLVHGIDAIFDAQSGLAHGLAHNVCVLVIADAAEIDDVVGREHVLRAAGCILDAAACNQRGVMVV